MPTIPSAPLDLSQRQPGAFKPESADFSVATLFATVRREFAAVAAAQGLELQVDATTERAYSDARLVEQILSGLVANAIAHTSAGRVQLQCLREPSAIRIDVIDTGVGMRAEEIAGIFELDGHGDAVDGAAESVVRQASVAGLVKLLNLRLDVTSEPDRGSVFSLRLPRRPAPGTVPPAAPAGRDLHSDGPRVLLVEDDAGVRDATRMLLRVEGYRVTAVAGLAEAQHSVREQGSPDLVLSDYHLANGETGIDVISALRNMLGPDVKAVLMSGDAASVLREVSGDARLRIASKPIHAAQLLLLMRLLLAN
jgi:CheY-like chemotaxis protein